MPLTEDELRRSRRPRTPDVYWPPCGNYDRINPPSPKYDYDRSRTYEQRHHVNRQEKFCNRVQWAIEDYLEKIAYRLVDDLHYTIYSFQPPGAVTADYENDPKVAWAEMPEAPVVTGDFFRFVHHELFASPDFRDFHAEFGVYYWDPKVDVDAEGLRIGGRRIPRDQWDRELTEYRRRFAAVSEQKDGDFRRKFALVKERLPERIKTAAGEKVFPIAAVTDYDRDGTRELAVFFHAPRRFYTEWTSVPEVRSQGDGPHIDAFGRLGIQSTLYANAPNELHASYFSYPDDRDMEIMFINKTHDQRIRMFIPRADVISIEDLRKRYPAKPVD